MPDQPPPVPNDARPTWELVIQDMHARDHAGAAKYGVHLQAHNGRDSLRDAYEESMDKTVYLKNAMIERDADKRRIAELEADNAALRAKTAGPIDDSNWYVCPVCVQIHMRYDTMHRAYICHTPSCPAHCKRHSGDRVGDVQEWILSNTVVPNGDGTHRKVNPTRRRSDLVPKMTPEEAHTQRVSFAFGNVSLHKPDVTREDVERAADLLAPKE